MLLDNSATLSSSEKYFYYILCIYILLLLEIEYTKNTTIADTLRKCALGKK